MAQVARQHETLPPIAKVAQCRDGDRFLPQTPKMTRVPRTASVMAAVVAGALTVTLSAGAIEICSGGNRAARGVTCVVDADTWWDQGVKYRHAQINAPEISPRGARCEIERRLGLLARDRLRELMSGGFQTIPLGVEGAYGRELATIRLADGREAGAVLVTEGLAKIFSTLGHKEWCL